MSRVKITEDMIEKHLNLINTYVKLLESYAKDSNSEFLTNISYQIEYSANRASDAYFMSVIPENKEKEKNEKD